MWCRQAPRALFRTARIFGGASATTTDHDPDANFYITLSVILTVSSIRGDSGENGVRILKNKAFTRFAKKAAKGDAVLCEAIRDAERGLIAADLGGGVIKQRIAALARESPAAFGR